MSKERSAKQKAADKRNGARLKRWMASQRGVSRAPRSSRSSRSRGSVNIPKRSGAKSHTYGLIETGGGVALGGGLLLTNGSAGRTAWRALKGQETISNVAYHLKESIPLIGKDQSLAEERKLVAAGAVAIAGGPLLRKVPIIGRYFRKSTKLDARTRLRIA